jgi:site-specific recombinase XerD
MFDPASVSIRGPLTPFINDFWSELMKQGYAAFSGRNLLLVAAHVSRWLEGHALAPSDLTVERIAAFAAHRRRQGYTQFRTPRALRPLLAYLRRIGVAPQPSAIVETSADRFARQYAEYLVRERGLVATTIRRYTDFARRFIAAELGAQSINWRQLSAADVTKFVTLEFRHSSIGQCKHIVSQLRSLLRYLHVQGLANDLAGCVPAVAGWRLASLPKGLETAQVEQLLASQDRRTTVGCRDHAVLCLLVRLGLRAGEVAALCLGDIDWRAAEFVVRGKGRRDSRLPLPTDVGQALVAYLRRRPRVACRAVLLCVRAPHRAITSQAVSGLTRRALRAIGVSAGSAHVLRHTAATQMLRRGASLSEVGHVLRHRHLDTTAIYAKVDDTSLRALAQPWPGGAL